MHAKRSGAGDPGHCSSCEGTGKSQAARAAEAVAKMTGAERVAAFGSLDVEARSRLYESNREMYDALRDAAAEAGQ